MSGGPKAPKDPTKKGAYFYIMQERDVFGAEQPDGRGVQFIYENDNRLIDSAKIVGNISDEEILGLLKTTEGFRKLVKTIGVSVMEPTMQEKVTFVFQMYGKTDTYGSGTNIKADLLTNGAETLIEMDEIDWSDDDKEPGQIRFEFEHAKIQAQVSVRFYLHEGFTAPEPVVDAAVDEESKSYRDMIERSLMQLGNPARVKRAIEKARRGEDVTLAYIGGSITQGAGAVPISTNSYAYQCTKAFAKTYGTGDNVHLVKAGVGGTPSELGMIRFERDVLRDGTVAPDVVVIEFAVNDEGDETKGVCYESLVKKALSLPNKPAVVLIFAVFSFDWNLQERLSPVGRKYDLPMVSVLDAVTPQFKLKREEGRAVSKNQFFYDIYHPSNRGHKIMAQCLMRMFAAADQAEAAEDHTDALLIQEPAIGADFEKVELLDRKDIPSDVMISEGAFTDVDEVLQGVEMDDHLHQTPEFPNNWMFDGTSGKKFEAFEMTISCKALLLVFKDSGALDVGKADVYVDGVKTYTADPRATGWVHCNAAIVLNEKESAQHTVCVRVPKEDEDKKFTILGFGYVR